MRRLLRVPPERSATVAQAQSSFRQSIVLSGIRCLLTYILIPFVAPIVGFSAAIDAPLGIAVGLAAMVSIVASSRQFFAADHRSRWAYTSLGAVMFCFLVFLLFRDVGRLLTG